MGGVIDATLERRAGKNPGSAFVVRGLAAAGQPVAPGLGRDYSARRTQPRKVRALKVNDIRPDDLQAAFRIELKKDFDMLRSWRSQFVEVDCPACGSRHRSKVYTYEGFDFQRCDECRTQYMSPRPTSELLAKYYSISANYAFFAEHFYPATKETRRQRIFAPRADRVRALCEERGLKGGTFIEVGAGYGIFCEELNKIGLFDRVLAIEPGAALAEACRQAGVEVLEKAYEEVSPDVQADVVAMFEVIEHLFSPSDFLAWAFKTLRPGGAIILTCPNIEGLDTLLLGEHASAVDPHHLNYFLPASITRLLEGHGFQDVDILCPGLLDVDLLRRAFAEGKIAEAQLGPFLTKIMKDDDPRVDGLFQSFLQDAKLSSNMMAIARKPMAAAAKE